MHSFNKTLEWPIWFCYFLLFCSLFSSGSRTGLSTPAQEKNRQEAYSPFFSIKHHLFIFFPIKCQNISSEVSRSQEKMSKWACAELQDLPVQEGWRVGLHPCGASQYSPQPNPSAGLTGPSAAIPSKIKFFQAGDLWREEPHNYLQIPKSFCTCCFCEYHNSVITGQS